MSDSVMIQTLETVLEYVKGVLPECVCRRAWASETDLKKLAQLDKPLLSVVLVDKEERPCDRETKETTFKIILILQRKLGNTSNEEKLNEEVDPLIALLEKLFSAFSVAVTLGGMEFSAVCKRPEHGSNAPIYFAEEIVRKNHFLGTLLIEVVTTMRR